MREPEGLPLEEENAVSVATGQYSWAMQGELWSARALDWANHQEPQFHEIYTAVLGAVPKVAGQRMLDAGCGSGAFIRRAAKHGAIVTGLDAAVGLVAIARKRVPEADLRVGEIEMLPYGRESFDIVTGINTYFHAADPVAALVEARRVLRPGGRVVAVTWGRPEQSDASGHLFAAQDLMPPTPDGPLDPFQFSAPGALTDLVEAAGFQGAEVHEVSSTWDYPDQSTLLRGLLSSGALVRAVAHSGSYAVTSAVLRAVAPYRIAGGGYHLRNVFHYVVATA